VSSASVARAAWCGGGRVPRGARSIPVADGKGRGQGLRARASLPANAWAKTAARGVCGSTILPGTSAGQAPTWSPAPFRPALPPSRVVRQLSAHAEDGRVLRERWPWLGCPQGGGLGTPNCLARAGNHKRRTALGPPRPSWHQDGEAQLPRVGGQDSSPEASGEPADGPRLGGMHGSLARLIAGEILSRVTGAKRPGTDCRVARLPGGISARRSWAAVDAPPQVAPMGPPRQKTAHPRSTAVSREVARWPGQRLRPRELVSMASASAPRSPPTPGWCPRLARAAGARGHTPR